MEETGSGDAITLEHPGLTPTLSAQEGLTHIVQALR